MCQSVNILRKIAVENASYFFTYFCGGHKNNFVIPLKFRKLIQVKTWILP